MIKLKDIVMIHDLKRQGLRNGMVGSPDGRTSGTGGLDGLRLGWRIEPDAAHAADVSLDLRARPGTDGTGSEPTGDWPCRTEMQTCAWPKWSFLQPCTRYPDHPRQHGLRARRRGAREAWRRRMSSEQDVRAWSPRKPTWATARARRLAECA